MRPHKSPKAVKAVSICARSMSGNDRAGARQSDKPERSAGTATFRGAIANRLPLFLAFIAGLALMLPSAAFAQTEISDWNDLDDVRNDLTGDYVLVNDLDSTTAGYDSHASSTANGGDGWDPIGGDFTGSFDGQGHTVDGLYINRSSNDRNGLFAYIRSGGEVTNLGVTNVDLTGQNVMGGLAGRSEGGIENCFTTGVVEGKERVGGLVGYNEGTITNSFSRAEVISDHEKIGGLVGDNAATIRKCYSTGVVDDADTGSTVGGLTGREDGDTTVEDSFWDEDTSGQTSSGGGTGKTTSEMKDVATFTDTATTGLTNPWDFVGDPNDDTATEDIWDIEGTTNDGYPYLAGTEEHPYEIATLADLQWLEGNPDVWDKHFIQTADIDASGTSTWDGGAGFSPIGNDTTNFTGSYDGQGYVIDGLVIDRSDSDDQALFGYVGGGATLENVGIENVDITGDNQVGGLAGRNYGNVTKSYVTGNVKANNSRAGGLIGYNQSTGDVSESYATGNVTGDTRIGGLVGTSTGDVSESYATADVSGDPLSSRAAGLVETSSGKITKSYATGNVSAPTSAGLVVENQDGGEIYDSYWNKETTNQDSAFVVDDGTSENLHGLTTPEMRGDSAYDYDTDSGNMDLLDFTNTWETVEGAPEWTGDTDSDWATPGNWFGDGYPVLQNLDRDTQIEQQDLDDGTVPTPSDDVNIPSTANDPVIGSDTVAECNNLTVDGDASLTIESAAADQTGTLIPSGSSSGEVTVERWLEGNRWYIVSPPVTNQDIGAFLTNGDNDIPYGTEDQTDYYAVTTYDEENNRWKQDRDADGYFTTSTSGNFDAGTGYLMRRGSDGTVSFTGTLETSDNTDVTVTVSESRYGWNCVSNPYTSPIGITSGAGSTQNFLDVNTDNLHPDAVAIYVWDADHHDGDGGYRWVNDSKFGFYDTWDSDYVALGQGFFVRPDDPESIPGSGTINFTSGMREGLETDPSPPMLMSLSEDQAEETSWPGVMIYATVNEDTEDESTFSAGVTFHEDMTLGLDPGYDARAFKHKPEVAVYTRLVDEEDSDSDFGLQALPSSALTDVTVPIGLDTGDGGEVTFSFERIEMPQESTVTLEDTEEDTEVEIASQEDTYTAEVDAEDDGYGRFYLSFEALETPEYTLTYTAGAGGRIEGETEQTVRAAAYGSAVTAKSDAGYFFDEWSDGEKNAERVDENVLEDISVEAEFVEDTRDLDDEEIQEKLDDAAAGDTVEIDSGIYEISEPLVLDKEDITLTSEGATLDIGGREDVIIIDADGVTVEGFTIQNFFGTGIDIRGDNALIEDCVIDGAPSTAEEDPAAAGVLINGAAGATVSANSIEDAQEGIKVRGAAENAIISNNTIARNRRGLLNESDVAGNLPHNTRAVNNNIESNSKHGAEWDAGGVDEQWLKAVHNWWGDPSGPSGDEDGEGDSVSGDVDVHNWIGSRTTGKGRGSLAGAEDDMEDVRDLRGGVAARPSAGTGGMVFATAREQGDVPEYLPASSYSALSVIDYDGLEEITVEMGYNEPTDGKVYWLDGDNEDNYEWIEVESDPPLERNPNGEVRAKYEEEGYDGYVEFTIGSDGATRPDLSDFSSRVFSLAGSDGSGDDDSSSSTDCFIATAAFGTPMAAEIDALRGLRDQHLIGNHAGRAAVEAYYSLSPPIAGLIEQNDAARALVRKMLRPAVSFSRKLNNKE